MTTNTEYAATPPLPPAPRPPLRRSQSDKVIAGVAGGFARWLGIDPVIVRVILVVLAIFGGSGLLLYAIGWLFIPVEGSTTSSADQFLEKSRQPGSTARTWLIVIGVIVAVIVFLNLMSFAFGGWGGGGSFLLLLAVGGLVLYLVNRQPYAAIPVAAAPAADGPAAPVTGTDPSPGTAATTAVETVSAPTPSDAATMSATSAQAPPPPPPPPAYAYGGAGQYPGYVPPQPTPMPPQPPKPRSFLGLVTLSIAVLVTGFLAALAVTGIVDLPPVVIPAVALAILGAGILVGAVVGRARWLLWIAVPTLFITLMVSFIPANFGEDFRTGIRAGIGERSWTPTTVAEATREHTLGIGSAELDLSDLQIPPGTTTVPVDATVSLGELVVTVPDDVRVIVDASVGTGELTVEGLTVGRGPSPSLEAELPGGPAAGPVIDLTVHTNVGSLEVSRA